MTETELHTLIKKDRYQVFLLCSRVPLPLPVGMHGWFVINIKGEVHRWEFGQFINSPHKYGIGLLKDFFKLTIGMNKYAWKPHPRWDSKLLQVIEGDEDSQAAYLAKFINERSEEYPYKSRYFLLGPNSNTYLQWVLSKFPKAGISLPSDAIGKGFKIKE